MPLPRSKAAKGNRTRKIRAQLQQKAEDRLHDARQGLRDSATQFGAAALLEKLDVVESEEEPEHHKRIVDGFIQHHMNALVERKLKKEELEILNAALGLQRRSAAAADDDEN